MKTKHSLMILALIFSHCLFAQKIDSQQETIDLSLKDVAGRWLEKNENKPGNIYLFKEDSTFFKAVNNQDLIIFNIAGRFKLQHDTICITYQDMSQTVSAKSKVRKMYLKVISLSDKELIVDKTERYRTTSISLSRQE